MTTVRVKVLAFLTVFVTVCSIIAVAAFGGSGDVNANGKLYIATTDEFDGMIRGGDDIPGADVKGTKRLSQNITVTTQDGTLSVGGTVTKNQDSFYPGTYIVSFSKNSILSSMAVVEVRMKVSKGDTVYVLVGDKEKGYSEFTTVVADRDNEIEFETNILQDYTLSTTDIMRAQEAMACVLSSEYELMGD